MVRGCKFYCSHVSRLASLLENEGSDIGQPTLQRSTEFRSRVIPMGTLSNFPLDSVQGVPFDESIFMRGFGRRENGVNAGEGEGGGGRITVK